MGGRLTLVYMYTGLGGWLLKETSPAADPPDSEVQSLISALYLPQAREVLALKLACFYVEADQAR